MMNKIRIMLMLFVLGVCTVHTPAFAGECTEEAKQAARQNAIDAAKQTSQNVKPLAEKYNQQAEDYIKTCNPNLPLGTPIAPSIKNLSAAEQAGIDIKDESLYKYRGIMWESVKISPGCKNQDCTDPKNMEECKEKAEAASNALQQFDSAIREAERQLSATTDDEWTNCQCDENGKVTGCATQTNTDAIEASEGQCKMMSSFLNLLKNCPLCPLFEVVMNTNAEIAHISWEATAAPLSKTVVICFLVLLALEALKAVASIGGTKPSAVIKGVLVLGLKIAITIGLLSSSSHIYGLFISPVIQGGLEMGLAIAQSAGGAQCTVESVGSISSQEFSPEIFNSVLRTVNCFSRDASTLPAVGMGLICHSFSPFSFKLFLSGCIMLFFGMIIWLSFAFYLIDTTVQLGMLSAMVPFLIACWPFEMTKQYTVKGVRMLMNSFFTFALAGVLMLMSTHIMTAAIAGDGSTTVQDILQAIDGDVGALKKLVSVDCMAILILIACGILAIKLIGKVSTIADQFSKGSGSAIGADIGAKAAGTATNFAKKTRKLAQKAANFSNVFSLGLSSSGVTGTANDVTDSATDSMNESLAEAGRSRRTNTREAVRSQGSTNDPLGTAQELIEKTGKAIESEIGGGHDEDGVDDVAIVAATVATGGAAAGATGGAAAGAEAGTAAGAEAGATAGATAGAEAGATAGATAGAEAGAAGSTTAGASGSAGAGTGGATGGAENVSSDAGTGGATGGAENASGGASAGQSAGTTENLNNGSAGKPDSSSQIDKKIRDQIKDSVEDARESGQKDDEDDKKEASVRQILSNNAGATAVNDVLDEEDKNGGNNTEGGNSDESSSSDDNNPENHNTVETASSNNNPGDSNQSNSTDNDKGGNNNADNSQNNSGNADNGNNNTNTNTGDENKNSNAQQDENSEQKDNKVANVQNNTGRNKNDKTKTQQPVTLKIIRKINHQKNNDKSEANT